MAGGRHRGATAFWQSDLRGTCAFRATALARKQARRSNLGRTCKDCVAQASPSACRRPRAKEQVLRRPPSALSSPPAAVTSARAAPGRSARRGPGVRCSGPDAQPTLGLVAGAAVGLGLYAGLSSRPDAKALCCDQCIDRAACRVDCQPAGPRTHAGRAGRAWRGAAVGQVGLACVQASMN